MRTDRPILLTGIHRSGTTFTGRVLSIPHSAGYIDEPFNLQYGIEGVREWFPYARAGDANDPLTLFDDVVAGRAKYRRPESAFKEPSFAHRLGRTLLKSRPNIAYQYFRLNPFLRQVIVKDPFLCFLSERLHRERSIPVIVLVRHPAAFVASVRRCGFHFDIRNLMQNQSLMEDFLGPVLDGVDPAGLSKVEHAAWTWQCIYSVLFQFLDRNPGMIAVRHEDICANPVQEFESLYKKLKLPFTGRIQKRIEQLTSDHNPANAPGNKIHHLQRDSRGLVESWKSALSSEEIETIRSITEATATRMYTDCDWDKE